MFFKTYFPRKILPVFILWVRYPDIFVFLTNKLVEKCDGIRMMKLTEIKWGDFIS